MSFKATKLQELRLQHCKTITQLAEELDIDKRYLSKVERGAVNVKRETARLLFEFYDGKIALGEIYDTSYFNKHREVCTNAEYSKGFTGQLSKEIQPVCDGHDVSDATRTDNTDTGDISD